MAVSGCPISGLNINMKGYGHVHTLSRETFLSEWFSSPYENASKSKEFSLPCEQILSFSSGRIFRGRLMCRKSIRKSKI